MTLRKQNPALVGLKAEFITYAHTCLLKPTVEQFGKLQFQGGHLHNLKLQITTEWFKIHFQKSDEHDDLI